MTRVLFISSSFSADPRTYHSVCQDLADAFESVGVETHITSRKRGRLARALDMCGAVWLKRGDYDIALMDVYSGWAFVWAFTCGLILKALDKPFILTLHGGNLPVFGKRRPRLVKMLLGWADAVNTPSLYMQQQMSPYHPAIGFIPNPLDLALYRFRERQSAAPRLIWLRAFHEVYQPTMAVEVVNHLRAEYPDIHMLMIGPDKGDGSLQKTQALIHQLELDSHITFTGGIPKQQVGAHLDQHDIFINTSRTDNLPVSITEAMACGLIVISTNVGAIPYKLLQSRAGLVVPPGDVSAMADAVRQVLNQPDFAHQCSINAFESTREYQISTIVQQWMKIIQGISDRNRLARRTRSQTL